MTEPDNTPSPKRATHLRSFDELSWTVDHALAWIATGDRDRMETWREQRRLYPGWEQHFRYPNPRQVLFDALARGDIRARPPGEKPHNPEFWKDRGFRHRFPDVRFEAVDVRALWPPLAENREEPALNQAAEVTAAPGSRRAQPDREIARKLLERAFPDGIPVRGSMKSGELCARVNKIHEKADGVLPKRDTILRAAGWRKD
jgi:hypothetical protein